MKSFNEMRTQIDEVLNKSDDMSKWISDFLDSDAPQFKGKSKEKKMQMAKAAYYAAQKEGVMQPNGTDKVGRLKEMKCWDGYKKQGTKIGRSGKVVNNCVKKEDIELDESTEALKKKAEKSGVSLSVLKKVYARGVAAWNSGHRPGTTPQQWGMARVNSYITKGKGTYHGADKDLREERDEDHPYHKGVSKSTAAKREAHWKKKEKLSDKNPKAYEPAPGDKTAETKPSKHTKKYKELYGEMKKMNEIGDTAKGQKALKSYSDKAFKSQDKAEAEYDHDHFDSGHHNAKAAHTITKREIGRERAAKRIKKEDYEVKHLDSYKDGRQAAKDGKKYSDNPHPKNSKAHLNWSKGHNTQRANKMNKEGYKSDAQRKAVWASRNEDVELVQGLIEQSEDTAIKQTLSDLLEAANGFDPKAMARVRKLAQMAAQHAAEKERMAKQHASEKERAKSQNESTAAKIVKTKLSTMAAKNVRIPSPEERRAEIEKRKQMQKEDIDMLSFDDYLQEDMRIAKATSMAKKHAGNMTAAVKAIDSIRKGLSNHPKVKDALKKANEELSAKQKKLDHNKNGKIDGDDLAKVRAGKTVNELSKGTLKSYADKAHQDSLNKAYDAAHTGDRKESDKLHKQAAKRADNVKKADMKASMKKEENLDELSKKTLGSYVKKASFNAAQSAYQAGGSNGNIAKLQPHMDKLNKRTAGVNKATDKLTKEDVEVETKSYKEFVNEMQSGSYKHKGTRYGGSAQVDHDHEKDFGIDNEKEKFKRLLQKKKPEQKPAQTSTVKRGRGRPMGSKSGARN